MSEGRFGFNVKPKTDRYSLEDGGYVRLDPPLWKVRLPHQCETWDINDEDGTSQAEAITELERFIVEAQEALTALRKGEAFGDLP